MEVLKSYWILFDKSWPISILTRVCLVPSTCSLLHCQSELQHPYAAVAYHITAADCTPNYSTEPLIRPMSRRALLITGCVYALSSARKDPALHDGNACIRRLLLAGGWIRHSDPLSYSIVSITVFAPPSDLCRIQQQLATSDGNRRNGYSPIVNKLWKMT